MAFPFSSFKSTIKHLKKINWSEIINIAKILDKYKVKPKNNEY
jgi:hypothetical protein